VSRFIRRPRADEAAVAYLSRQARAARDLIGPFSAAAVAALQAEAATLPDRCELFTSALLATPGVAASIREMRRGVVALALRAADTPEARVTVAKTIVALRESGMVDEHLAAAALVELVSGRSPLTEAALLRAASGPSSRAVATAPSPTTIRATA
jgi:hypothetical protein